MRSLALVIAAAFVLSAPSICSAQAVAGCGTLTGEWNWSTSGVFTSSGVATMKDDHTVLYNGLPSGRWECKDNARGVAAIYWVTGFVDYIMITGDRISGTSTMPGVNVSATRKGTPADTSVKLPPETPLQRAKRHVQEKYQVTVDDADLAAIRSKLAAAIPYFGKLWNQMFAASGHFHVSPQVHEYMVSTTTACGDIGWDNALYCSKDNSIHYDIVFLAALMKMASKELHTDGDYAAVVVLAHEWGHLVLEQLYATGFQAVTGVRMEYHTIFQEDTADCLAGGLTHEIELGRALDKGDVEEGRFVMRMTADPRFRDDFKVSDPYAHGDAEERTHYFDWGYQGGVGACNYRLNSLIPPPPVRRTATGASLFVMDSQKKQFAEGTSANCRKWYSAGYNLENINPSGTCEVPLSPIGNLPAHVRMEAYLRLDKGPRTGEFGIKFGQQTTPGGDSFYTFLVGRRGAFQLAFVRNGKRTALIDWTKEMRVGTTDFSIDILVVEVEGRRLRCNLGDEYVGEAFAPASVVGGVGLLAGQQGMVLNCDLFYIYNLPST